MKRWMGSGLLLWVAQCPHHTGQDNHMQATSRVHRYHLPVHAVITSQFVDLAILFAQKLYDSEDVGLPAGQALRNEARLHGPQQRQRRLTGPLGLWKGLHSRLQLLRGGAVVLLATLRPRIHNQQAPSCIPGRAEVQQCGRRCHLFCPRRLSRRLGIADADFAKQIQVANDSRSQQ
eukprot:TRINITY_DN7933_c0_g1_i6.p1 TRINITY_DN7933_c0_g1~~TRINITY_DN7933_c0_g1_i6.p1  ORF type:complete len:176 (-),score=8.94 TRINITY_DN7933_c0_g1_i6:21-548(-)